jgi:hypothetical protein
VTALALSGKFLLATSYDGMIRCYNTEVGVQLRCSRKYPVPHDGLSKMKWTMGSLTSLCQQILLIQTLLDGPNAMMPLVTQPLIIKHLVEYVVIICMKYSTFILISACIAFKKIPNQDCSRGS